jgi:two-component system sensor histidine kinase ChvG
MTENTDNSGLRTLDRDVGTEPLVRKRGLKSPLTRRILALNVLALAILVGGLLYLGEYRKILIETKLVALQTQGEVLAASLGEGAVTTGFIDRPHLIPFLAEEMIIRLVGPTGIRARLFGVKDWALLADSLIHPDTERAVHRDEALYQGDKGLDRDLLEENARFLESVLDEFGIRGAIIKVRPGPIVTLYELEPAPGTKTSRVIGLADDIARSMSAISARISAIPGRNAIGIELPNATRKTVLLRELLESKSEGFRSWINGLFDRIDKFFFSTNGMFPPAEVAPYNEPEIPGAVDFDEVMSALQGESARALRADREEGMTLYVAVPVQRYKQIMGAVLLSRGGEDILATLRSVRLDILKIFAVTLAVTVTLSLYLADTIARPIHDLAEAAERVRRHRDRHVAIPDFTEQGDEIGDLSGAFSDMTAALWQRMDAIESFAADVAHEIKNPLTSLHSAVETVAGVKDPEQWNKLLAVVLDDVQRIDRLISDISDASRLDAELSRATRVPVDVAALLVTLSDMHNTTSSSAEGPFLTVEAKVGTDFHVAAIEDRLAQVFRNLIANAVSFSPPGGRITCRITQGNAGDGEIVAVTVEDQGPGIPESKRETIFERFYTERPEGEKFGTHSGLGLSISRQIVEAHGGTLRAENLTDRNDRVCGALFTVHLPRD